MTRADGFRRVLGALPFFVAAALAGCDDSADAGGECTPLAAEPCTGADGCTGTRRCNTQGTAFTECVCARPDAAPAIIPDAPAVPDAGIPDAAPPDAALCGTSTEPADHLLVTEVKTGPTAGEFIELHNPTASAIDLGNTFLYSATFGGASPCRYYNVVSGTACGDSNGDFSLRFPPGATIGAGDFLVVALTGADNYCRQYYAGGGCEEPDYEIPPAGLGDLEVPDMLGTWDDGSSVFTSLGFLTTSSEELVLFTWDGSSSTVEDLDYVIWGASEGVRTSKTGVDGYAADTPIAEQRPLAGATPIALSDQRLCLNEGNEVRGDGNGATGHDETSEDLPSTWITGVPTPGAPTVGALP